MVGNIKAGLILLFLIVISLSAEARVMRAGPGDGFDFRTNGNNSRVEFKSDGTVEVKNRLQVETIGELSRPFTTLTEIERDALTGAAGDITYNETSGLLNFFNTIWREILDSNSSQTVTNKIMDANSNTFSNFEHGSEVDNPSSGVHGVTGSVVGTTDAQDLSNKTFTNELTLEELASKPSAPTAGDKKLYCRTDDKCYQLNSADVETELGAGGGGGAGDVNNLLSDGGFDTDATTGTDGLTCATGTCSQETTNPFVGDGALKIALSAQAADVVKCYDNTNSQWDNQMIQIEGYLKSSAEFDFCYWDGTAEGNCETYGGSDDWQKVKIIESVQTENSICWKIKSTSITDDIFADVTSIFSLKVDGTTKIETETLSFNADSSTMTDRSGATDLRWGSITESGDDLINYDDSTGRFIALKKVDLNLSWGGTSGTTTAFNIRKNGTVITRCSDAASFEQTCPISVILNEGDYITMQSAIVLTGAATLNAVAKHYEQKSVLSDATAESTITDWESYTPNFSSGFTATSSEQFYWKRVGGDLHVRGRFTADTVAANIARISIPSGLTIKSSVVPNASNSVVGKYWRALSTSIKGGSMHIASSSTTEINFGPSTGYSGTTDNAMNTTNGSTSFSGGDAVTLEFRVPIEGWDAKPQIVGTFKPAVRSSKVSGLGAGVLGNATDSWYGFPTTSYNQDGNFNSPAVQGWTGTRTNASIYTIPEDGKYAVYAKFCADYGGLSDSNEAKIRVYKNTDWIAENSNTYEGGGGGGHRYHNFIYTENEFSAGDEVTIYGRQNSGSAATNCADTRQYEFSVRKLEQAGTIGGNEPTVKYDSGNFGTLGSTTAFVLTDTGANVDLTVGTWHITANTTVYMAGCSGTGVQGRFAYGEITDSSNNVIQDINGTVVRKSGEGLCQSGAANLGQIEIDAVVNITTAGNYKFRFASYENSTSTTMSTFVLYDASPYGSTTLKAVKY